MNDEVDEALVRYATRWREAQPHPRDMDLDLVLHSRETRRVKWIIPPAMAAAVAVLAVLIPQIPFRDQQRPPPPAATPSRGAVVPWAPLDPTHPSIPSVTIPPIPDPADAAGLPPCRAADLRTSVEHGGAGGTNYLFIIFQGGPGPCSLSGRPGVEPWGKGRRLSIPLEEGKVTGDTYEDPVRVDQNHAATLGLSWTSLWCTEPVVNDTIKLLLPQDGGRLQIDGFGHSPACNGEPGSGPAPIVVAGFQPQQFRPQRVTSPYADVKVQLEAPAAVRAGSRLAFVIVLTAERGDVVLDPCPDYTILQAIDSDNFTEESFALNCPVVPYRDADGRPRLPEGVPVHFAMETTALAVATNGMKFTWGIEAPDAMSAGTGMSISPP